MVKEGKEVVRMEAVQQEEEAIISFCFIHFKIYVMEENVKGQNNQDREQQRPGKLNEKESGGMQNASANRGGTTDMDDEALTTGRRNTQERGSGISTKNSVTGSDYDGQLAAE